MTLAPRSAAGRALYFIMQCVDLGDAEFARPIHVGTLALEDYITGRSSIPAEIAARIETCYGVNPLRLAAQIKRPNTV